MPLICLCVFATLRVIDSILCCFTRQFDPDVQLCHFFVFAQLTKVLHELQTPYKNTINLPILPPHCSRIAKISLVTHLAKLQSAAFSVGCSSEEPISFLFTCDETRKQQLQKETKRKLREQDESIAKSQSATSTLTRFLMWMLL